MYLNVIGFSNVNLPSISSPVTSVIAPLLYLVLKLKNCVFFLHFNVLSLFECSIVLSIFCRILVNQRDVVLLSRAPRAALSAGINSLVDNEDNSWFRPLRSRKEKASYY